MGVPETLLKIGLGGPYVQFVWDYLFIHEAAPFRDIFEASKVDDKWPVSSSLDHLKRLGLVEERDDVWVLTAEGKKVRDVQATIRSVAVV